ncbi:type VI secretion system baseplate subunit TssF, partial [Achromobacter sp. AGC39]
MDARLLDYYNRELVYLRELGAEFAQAHPKVAGRLGMNATEVADPYVERLLEGFSFLTARIQMKMDAEFPRFSQRLLEVVYPNYLAPTPSMAIVQFAPSMNEGTLAGGFELPRGT